MAAVVFPWFTSISPSFVFAWAPVIIAVPTLIIPRAVLVSPAPAATFLGLVVARVAGIIRAWVIEALT